MDAFKSEAKWNSHPNILVSRRVRINQRDEYSCVPDEGYAYCTSGCKNKPMEKSIQIRFQMDDRNKRHDQFLTLNLGN